MGMFACFQGPSPSAGIKYSSMCYPFWGTSFDEDNVDLSNFPVVQEQTQISQHSTQQHHSLEKESEKYLGESPPHQNFVLTNSSPPHQVLASAPQNNWTNLEDQRPPLLLPPSPKIEKSRNSLLFTSQHHFQDNKPSSTCEHSENQNLYVAKQIVTKQQNLSKSPDKHNENRHPSAPPRLTSQENHSKNQKIIHDWKEQRRTAQSITNQNKSPTRNKPPPDYFSTTQNSSSPHQDVLEHGKIKSKIRTSSPPENAIPIILPRPIYKSHRLKNDYSPPPIIHRKKVKEVPSDCYSSTPSSKSNVITFKSPRSIVCHHQHWKPQMGDNRQQDQKQRWINNDAEHIYQWEAYNSGSERGQTLANELNKEIARDLAKQQKRMGREQQELSQSPRSLNESCIDSYCSRAENPLIQKSYESKFPYGTPQDNPISPPGWTYSPKRKNKRGEWWDKDWPKNKKYIYHDPNLQPCGCSQTKRHFRTQTPSPPLSTRAKGIAYGDQVVKINRERSLSPKSKSHMNLESSSEQLSKHPCTHIHLDWSCSSSPRTSFPSPISRAKTPTMDKEVSRSRTSTPISSTQHHTPRRKVKLEGSIFGDMIDRYPESEQESNLYPSNGRGYCAPLSRATTPPWPIPNVQNYPDSPCTSSLRSCSHGRFVKSRALAPIRQRPKNQNIHIHLSSSSGHSTPCSISVQKNNFYDHDDRFENQGREAREKYVGTMGHCHTPGSWSCTSQDSSPTTPRKLTPNRNLKSDNKVTITCPPGQDLVVEPGQSCDCLCHCPCTHNHIDPDCCNDQCCRTTPRRRVIGGPCDWHHVVHHHRSATSHYCCSYCHC